MADESKTAKPKTAKPKPQLADYTIKQLSENLQLRYRFLSKDDFRSESIQAGDVKITISLERIRPTQK